MLVNVLLAHLCMIERHVKLQHLIVNERVPEQCCGEQHVYNKDTLR